MARYDKLRKTARDLAIIKYQAEHPDDSLEEIGAAFGGLSRQRVWQVCNKAKKLEGK